MKKTKITFLLLFLSVCFINAQTLVWARSMGAVNWDETHSIAVDPSGNVYSTGNFEFTVDFDPGAGVVNLTSAGAQDIFVSKLNASGNFLWAVNMGGTGIDYAHAITTDASGNVYITGYFQGTADFDPGSGTFNLTASGSSEDAFITKLDAAGNFVWAKKIGGFSQEDCYAITIDGSGNVYACGYFMGSVDFDPGTGTFMMTAPGSSASDSFILKLDAAGNFIWAKQLGGTSNDGARAIVTDASGNVYTTGYFSGTSDFDPGTGTFTIVAVGAGSGDIFVSKLDASGNFVFAKAMGSSSGNDEGNAIALDGSGNIYTTGTFQLTSDFNPAAGTFTLSSLGGNDIFISKLDGNGNFVWAKRMGSTNFDFGFSITTDASGNVYTTGAFQGNVDFDPGAGTFNLTGAGGDDIFISKLDAAGNFMTAKQIGGTGYDMGYSIVTDASGNLYLGGYFNSTTDFDPDAGIFNLISQGGSDACVVKLNGSATGLNENINFSENTFSIYPNPSTGLFTIRSENNSNADIEIINVLGEVVYNKKISSLNEQIDTRDLTNGIYNVRISENNKVSTTKLMIQK